MSLTRIRDTAVEIIRNMPNRPTGFGGRMSAAALKMAFDQAAENIKNAVNQMIGELEATGGAAEIGFQRSTGVPADTVQSAIENVQQQLVGVTQDAVANGSITAEKLSSDVFSWTDVIYDQGGDRIEPYASEDCDGNNLRFLYCAPLRMMRVEGYVSFTWYNSNHPNVKFTLPMIPDRYQTAPLYAQIHDSFVSSANQRFDLKPFAEIYDNYLEVHLYGLQQSDRGVQHTVYIHGWYFCEEAT